MTDRTEILRAYAGLRPRLAEIREQAMRACFINPVAWLAVHGVSLAEYLTRLDKLDELCAKAEADLVGAPPPTEGQKMLPAFWNFPADAGNNYPQPLHASGRPGWDVYPGFSTWP